MLNRSVERVRTIDKHLGISYIQGTHKSMKLNYIDWKNHAETNLYFHLPYNVSVTHPTVLPSAFV